MSKIIAITGGIATGKSAVTAYLRSCGFTVLDADEIVHELQQPGHPLYQAIRAAFGSAYFDNETKQLNRKKLGALIFSDKMAREKLSALQDSVIRAELLRQMRATADRLFFVDIPLLFEAHYERSFDEIWLVTLPRELQLSRLMARNQLTEAEAQARMATQWPLADKEKRADIIFDNSGTVEDLYKQVDSRLKELEMIRDER